MKQFKLFILLAIGLITLTNFTTTTTTFDGLVIFEDNFEDNRNNWNFTSEYAQGEISDGYYELQSYGERSDIRVQTIDLVNQENDFEIEASIKIEGKSEFCNSIIWGTSSFGGNYEQGISFGFNTKQQFIALETVDWVAQDFFEWQLSEVIKENDFNKLVVRKKTNKYYFYINDRLVKICGEKAFTGQNFGFHAANGATILVDYYKVTIFVPRA